MNDVLFVSLANLMIPKRLRVCLNTKTEVYILDKDGPHILVLNHAFLQLQKAKMW